MSCGEIERARAAGEMPPLLCVLLCLALTAALVWGTAVAPALAWAQGEAHADEASGLVAAAEGDDAPEDESEGDDPTVEPAPLVDAMFFVAYPEDTSRLPQTEEDLGDVHYSGAITVDDAICPAQEWLDSGEFGTLGSGVDG